LRKAICVCVCVQWRKIYWLKGKRRKRGWGGWLFLNADARRRLSTGGVVRLDTKPRVWSRHFCHLVSIVRSYYFFPPPKKDSCSAVLALLCQAGALVVLTNPVRILYIVNLIWRPFRLKKKPTRPTPPLKNSIAPVRVLNPPSSLSLSPSPHIHRVCMCVGPSVCVCVSLIFPHIPALFVCVCPVCNPRTWGEWNESLT